MSRVLLASHSLLLYVATAFVLLSAAHHVAAQAIPPACQDADDDGDTQINDGCPPRAAPNVEMTPPTMTPPTTLTSTTAVGPLPLVGGDGVDMPLVVRRPHSRPSFDELRASGFDSSD